MEEQKKILYCHCAYSQAVPKEIKEQVLQKLCNANISFEAVPDLCQLSAEKNPILQDFAREEDLQIVACYPRAVKWLFSAASASLSENQNIINMRTEDAESIVQKLSLKKGE